MRSGATSTTANGTASGTRALRSEIGWTLEIEIPFRTLNFDPAARAGASTSSARFVARTKKALDGMGAQPGAQPHDERGAAHGPHATSARGSGLDIKPYVLFTSRVVSGRGDASINNDANVGVDVFYSPTPSLRTNLTINTDFAQTEVDQRLLNLTRFPLFFPEKRDFFLDGSTFFDFQSNGRRRQQPPPVLQPPHRPDATATPQNIDVGGKMAGQFGASGRRRAPRSNRRGRRCIAGEDFLVCALQAANPAAVVRRRAVHPPRSTRAGETGTRHTIGADFLLATSTFLGSQNLERRRVLRHTTSPGIREELRIRLRGGLSERPLDASSTREIQDNYDAAVGFMTARSFRRFAPSLSYTPRPATIAWIRSIQFGGNLAIQTDLRQPSAEPRVRRHGDQRATHRQDSFQVHVVPTVREAGAPFAISPGIVLPAAASTTGTATALQAYGSASHGRRSARRTNSALLHGRADGLRCDLNLRLRPGVIIYTSPGMEQTWTSTKGDFRRTCIASCRAPVQSLDCVVNNIQYDTQSAQIGWQSRFRWILRPATISTSSTPTTGWTIR